MTLAERRRQRFPGGRKVTRSFGPVVVVSTTGEIREVHCSYCIFLFWRDGLPVCTHQDRKAPRPIPDAGATPNWCEMRASAIHDALDMARGVMHRVYRWSGRRSDQPRMIFEGIPSEAAREFRWAARDIRRGTVTLVDDDDVLLDRRAAVAKGAL